MELYSGALQPGGHRSEGYELSLTNSQLVLTDPYVPHWKSSFPDTHCFLPGSARSFPVSGRTKDTKRPLTHSDKRPYKLSRAWNYTPELFSLADTDPRGMNLVSRIVNRYLLILTFLIGRAPFLKDCTDYTTIRRPCQAFFAQKSYILHHRYIFRVVPMIYL